MSMSSLGVRSHVRPLPREHERDVPRQQAVADVEDRRLAVDDEVEQAARDTASRVAADPELARRLVRSFRRESAPGGVPWEVAVELERSPQMWSLRRKHG